MAARVRQVIWAESRSRYTRRRHYVHRAGLAQAAEHVLEAAIVAAASLATLSERAEALAVDVACTDDDLSVVLSDGRTVTVPVAWFPRLASASVKQRAGWELIGGGIGIHWEAIDEDISVASLLQPENFMRVPDPALQPPSRARGVRRTPKPRARATRG